LILTGLDGIEDTVRGLGFGAGDNMTKPCHKDELVARNHAIVAPQLVGSVERIRNPSLRFAE
jgi:DNA-binding response OmpR family regulator